MGTIGTTAQAIFTALKRPTTFVIHADSGNTGVIRLSQNDPQVIHDYEELLAGQSMSFEDFKGSVFAIASTGTQTYHFPFYDKEGTTQVIKQ
jgi:hypothetical protein